MGSKSTASILMPIGYTPASISSPDIAATIDDDFMNQLLYSAWRGGLLCITVDEDTFALDTSMLDLLTGNAFTELFPEPQPMIIKTMPENPPTLNLNTNSDIAIDIEDLGLNFFAIVDGRRTRLLNVALTTDVGVDLPFDASTGEMRVAIDLDTDRVTPNVIYNEFRPDASSTIEGSFAGQLDTILSLVDLDSMLGDLQFAFPSVSGFGLNDLSMEATGQNDEDLGAFAGIGPVPYENAGCGDSGDTSGCGGGCSTNGKPNSRLALLSFVALFGWLRRRSS
jgi:hypothetical protein